jgi:hypothetical protein
MMDEECGGEKGGQEGGENQEKRGPPILPEDG